MSKFEHSTAFLRCIILCENGGSSCPSAVDFYEQEIYMLKLRLILPLLIAFAFVPASVAAQDEGAYLILNAQYGTAEHHVDVTQRLRELARQDRLFRMGN